jgi:hypothetical protein
VFRWMTCPNANDSEPYPCDYVSVGSVVCRWKE